MTLRTLSLLALTGILLTGCYVVEAPPPAVYSYGYYERPHYRHYAPPPAWGYYGRPYGHRHYHGW
ncbi:hypothetical protein [Azospirillum sp. sgz302134]